MGLFDFLAPDVPTGTFKQQNNLAKKALQDLTEGRSQSVNEIKAGYSAAMPNFEKGLGSYEHVAQGDLGAYDMYRNSLGLNGQGGYDAALGAFQQGPGYQFALDEANQNVMRNAAAMGGLRGGGTAAALSDRAQQLQNLEFGNWQNRLQGMDPLRSIGANQGQYNTIANALINQGKDLSSTRLGFAGPIANQYNNQASLLGQQASMGMAADQQGIGNAIGLLGGISGFFGA